jgi:hypothetical protein
MGLILGLLSLVAYCIPGIIASCRHHHNATAIWVLNILVGWTVFGWVAVLVWSLTATWPSTYSEPKP